jgi:hypothetical protein
MHAPVSETDFPANGSPRQKLEFALTYAALAPTGGGWQPWYFQMGEAHIDLMAKQDLTREKADPDRREFMIGCGSALLYLKLALKHFGCLGRVDLFPDLGQPGLVARLYFGSGRERNAREKHLFEAMLEYRPDGFPLGELPVTGAMLTVLGHAADGERGWLDFAQSEISRRQVLEVAQVVGPRSTDRDGANISLSEAAAERQVARWPRLVFSFGGRGVNVRNEPVEEPSGSPAASTATLAVVKTKTDDKHGWVEAGQTMARTILQAQALGMSWAFVDPMRRREARAALRTGVGHKGFAQVILRFGPLIMDDGLAELAAPVIAPEIFR